MCTTVGAFNSTKKASWTEQCLRSLSRSTCLFGWEKFSASKAVCSRHGAQHLNVPTCLLIKHWHGLSGSWPSQNVAQLDYWAVTPKRCAPVSPVCRYKLNSQRLSWTTIQLDWLGLFRAGKEFFVPNLGYKFINYRDIACPCERCIQGPLDG